MISFCLCNLIPSRMSHPRLTRPRRLTSGRASARSSRPCLGHLAMTVPAWWRLLARYGSPGELHAFTAAGGDQCAGRRPRVHHQQSDGHLCSVLSVRGTLLLPRLRLTANAGGGCVSAARCARLCARRRHQHPIQDRVSCVQGLRCAFRQCSHVLQRGHATPGQTVFVHGGSGAVGVAAIQFARAMGLKVMGLWLHIRETRGR